MSKDELAILKLQRECTDWSIHKRDFPSHGKTFEVWAQKFIVVGEGRSNSIHEAVALAIKDMKKNWKKINFANPKDKLRL